MSCTQCHELLFVVRYTLSAQSHFESLVPLFLSCMLNRRKKVAPSTFFFQPSPPLTGLVQSSVTEDKLLVGSKFKLHPAVAATVVLGSSENYSSNFSSDRPRSVLVIPRPSVTRLPS